MGDKRTKGLLRRGFTFVVALAMVLACLPGLVFATASETPAEGTYVLESKLLTAFNAGDKTDGQEEKAGTDGYFTLVWSAKSKVDTSAKTWEDDYQSDLRINFGGKVSTAKNAVKFTTGAPAKVKIWWVQGGDDNRQMGILDSEGAEVVKTTTPEGGYQKNSPYYSELTLEAAGTYYLGGIENNNNIYKVVVEEEVQVTAKTYELESKLLTAFNAGDKTDGQEEKAGTDGYFTLVWSAKSKVDTSAKTWEDDYQSDLRINFGGKVSTAKNAVKFTTGAPAKVKIWWVQGGDDNRQMGILDSEGAEVVKTTTPAGGYQKNSPYYSELTLETAGTYYLGGIENNNNIYKVVVEEEVQVTAKTYELESKLLTAFNAGDKTDGQEEKAGTDGYFTLVWSAKSKVDTSAKTWEDDYQSDLRINFGGKVSTAKNAVRFTTGAPAKVKIWWVQGGDDNRQMGILDSEGAEVVKTTTPEGGYQKNSPYYSELTLEAAGTYYLGGIENNNNIYKVVVEEQGGGAKPPRAGWAGVADPVIKSVELNADKSKIDVTVTANVGYDGGDQVTIIMSDANGGVIDSQNSSAEKAEHVKTFAPGATGTYTFTAKLVREGETDKVTATGETFAFTLPLARPNVKGATNNGGGAVLVEWDAVKEADAYVVEARENDTVKASATDEEGKLSVILTGLEIGKTYSVTVTAKRGEESVVSDPVEVTVTAEKEIPWYFASFGSSTSTNPSQNGYSENEDGSVSVWSLGGKGKLVPNSTDGLSFYYTSLDPNVYNFKLTGKVHVDEWTYSNGQDGFGLMVSDRVGKHGAGADFWNNSYMAVVTKVEYNWNSIDGKLTDSGGTKYAMRLGIGSQEKINVTPENIGAPNLASEIFKSTMTTLETTAGQLALDAGNYNLIGNYTKDPGYPAVSPNLLTDFVFSIEKNPTGYFVSYTPEGASEPTVVKYYDPEALSHLDPDNVYLGFFASRNAKITVSDIELETVLVSEDTREPEERPVARITPSYTVESASVANTEAYDMVYYGNADGTLTVRDAAGRELFSGKVTALTKQHIPVTLIYGKNVFTVTMTPDPDYKPGEFEEMADYSPVTFTHTVNYAVNAREALYVAPNASGTGSKASPMDIYKAVQVVAPGHTIVLLEGTYHLTQTLTIQRGISGTEDGYITMMADPDARTRPVLDFGGNCAGMIMAGDYWHFYGFDVTNSANGQKGIQVSGSHNILERLFTYRNGNTGIQISRFKGSDQFEDWPADNLILNCSSYLNADSGYEDADGFAAKLTIGDGNRFYGCISAYNADDGWDLYAKVETGSIGTVVIENSLAFKNGWILDAEGKEVNAGNGNGFKMGGESLPGGHTLINSVSFANKAKGFDSNSCPDIKVYHSTSFNNAGSNVAMYTNSASETNYVAEGILSYKNDGGTAAENFKVKGAQKEDDLRGESNYYYDGARSSNSAGVTVDDTWFESVDVAAAIGGGIGRNADGSIDMGGFLVLTDAAAKNAGAHMDDTSKAPVVPALPELPEEPVIGPAAPSVPPAQDDTVTVPEGESTLSVELEAGDGQELDIAVRNGGEAAVEIPVKNVGYGTVAVIVREDGTEEVVRDCVLTEDGIVIRVKGSVTVKVEERGMEFADMAGAGQWARDAVAYVSARGLLGGTGAGAFSPAALTNRGMATTVLYRLIYEPETAGGDFSDVADGLYYAKAVSWAAKNGVVNGYGDGTFKPEKIITREELATVLYRFAKLRGLDLTVAGDLTGFEDADQVSAYAKEAMTWCVANGIINGVGTHTLAPAGQTTRAQVAAMIMRLCQLMGK